MLVRWLEVKILGKKFLYIDRKDIFMLKILLHSQVYKNPNNLEKIISA